MDNILNYDTVNLDEELDALVIIDQTRLPNRTEILKLTDAKGIWDAIYELKVRGAPAIGVAAAYGIYVLASRIDTDDRAEFKKMYMEKSEYLNSSRPTAVNLSWALKRMERVLEDNPGKEVHELKSLLKAEARRIHEEDTDVCRRIGENGLALIKPGFGLLTHCNAGQLATSKYGTATAPMYLAHEKGYNIRVYADETRPLLQGARLTSYELHSAGIDVTLLCDNMVASIMKTGEIDAVFVGCDRVAANGDAANKIGTSVVATVAKRYNVPFYVCAPTSTIDLNTATGDDIEIEQRAADEVTKKWYEKPMAPEGVKVYNPAFDVTDAELITAIVTEKGVLKPPYTEAIRKLFEK